MKHYLRQLPAVHECQKHPRFKQLFERLDLPFDKLTLFLQKEINDVRQLLLNEEWDLTDPSTEDFIQFLFSKVEERATTYKRFYLTRVINGTGTILHTNLGRARLSKEAIEHVVAVASNYSNLEYQLNEGIRGSRHSIIEDLIKEVTGAEAAMVVNNNAAAVYLILRGLAKDKEVIVSRGELVEIGGSFRVSSIMEESGANLVEVGTTNKTHLYDYENAINEETAMVMKVHTSNFKIIGFTDHVTTEALAKVSAEQNVIFYEDLGSGALLDLQSKGIGDEPVVRKVLEAGVDLVSFSGDKLLGGPQAGIIAGKKELITKLKQHQLARVLRVDKMTFAALEATIKAYAIGEEKLKDIPTIRDIVASKEEVKSKAESFLKAMNSLPQWTFELEETTAQIGGGTMPGVEIPSFAVKVYHETIVAHELAKHLRTGTPSIVPRIKDETLFLDFRTITQEEIQLVIERFRDF